ncbi:MAG: hemolysin III family protein [Longimicrobiales bacterium]|nr:hemolysin III family protein [Longimicrobiales bacterium]
MTDPSRAPPPAALKLPPDLDFDDPAEERASALTHAVGAVGSVVALVLLVVAAARGGDAREIVAVSIFGVTLVVLYLASTLYHLSRSPRVRARMKVIDHAAIYLLIAGTYTPFTLGLLRGGWGWSLLGVIWGLATAGVVFKLFFTGRWPRLSTAIYLLMGWLIVIAAVPLVRALDPAALAWLVAGGLAYTAGVPFYQMVRFRYAHAVWHLFVLAGSACHAVAIGLQL